MNLKAKNKLLEDINNAFVSVLAKNKNRSYTIYLNQINKELTDNIDKLDSAKVKEIVGNAKLNVDDTALLFMVLSAITLLVNNQRMREKDKVALAPIIAIMGIYTILKPKRFVEKIFKANKGNLLNGSEKKVQKLLVSYKENNIKTFKKIKVDTIKQVTQSQIKSSTRQGRQMVKQIKVMREQDIPTTKQIKTIKRNFKVNPNKAKMVLDTELHSQAELAKQIHSQAQGFTHKKWNTQGDSRVRETRWHNAVTNKEVPIDSDFRAGGLKASHPGDDRLPPSDRIRCRCFLTYK